MTLPTPSSERWKPLRAGLVDMFYYDVEEFHFHDGRLLLRGNNGTGKSKVLALTLPFLLDGELAPHRVEPDGDRQKRMEWNLLLGGKHPYPERLGYTWMEFGRVAADGAAEFRTLGCGLKAVAGRGIARHWFFVTPQRIGAELALISPTRVPLTREKLRDAVEGRGMVYDRAADYRRAVDEALFGLGEHRYQALVNLLIQLRQPQLSKKPDEKLLSKALTEALPPLSPALIETVAEAFRGLDEERDALRALAEARTAATDFLRYYGRYAAIAAKRKAAAPRLAQSRYEHLGRDLADAESRHEAAEAKLGGARQKLADLEDEKVLLEARREALQQSPEMRDAERLKHMGEEAERQADTARIRERDRDRLAAEEARRTGKTAEARRRVTAAETDLRAALKRADDAAREALCRDAHRAIVGDWDESLQRFGASPGSALRTSGRSDARRDTGVLAERQAHAVATLERLLAEVETSRRRMEAARAEVDRLTGELQDAVDRIADAETTTRTRAADLLTAYRGYLGSVAELRVPDPDGVLGSLETWAERGDGANPAVRAIDDAARSAGAELGRREAELTAERRDHEARAGELEAEIARLRAGGHDAPPPPDTRDSESRSQRPGAPLWKAIDFADGVSPQHRAGLEAALEASGILDAWLTPAGALLDDDDTVLVAGGGVGSGTACSAVFVPAIDRKDPRAAALPDSAVHAVLSAIGLGPGAETWIAADGRWSNGVLAGSWHKGSADYIGEGAREAARRARIARLTEDLETVRDRVGVLDTALELLRERWETLDAEHRAVPSDATLREAHIVLAGEHRRRQALWAEHTEAVSVLEGRQQEHDAAHARAAEFAADVGLPSGPDELASVKAGVGDYRVALAGLWPAAERHQTTGQDVTEAEEELAETRALLDDAAGQAAEAREAADAAAEIHRSLMETAGAAVEELYRRLDEVRRDLERRAAEERAARGDEQHALGERGKAEGVRETLRGEINEAARTRDAAVAEFQAFAATGLLRVALPTVDLPDLDTPWAATPAVILARTVNAELDGVDEGDGPWDRIQKKVSEEHKLLSDSMARHGHSVGLTLRDGIMVIDVEFQGRTHEVPELAAALADETTQRGRLLSAKEREILENHLLNEVAGTLHELITTAEAEVEGMNDELASRPTSTGMRLRLIWQPARHAPDGLNTVRPKLRQMVDAWSLEDRATVGAFLQERIAAEHTENPAAGWTEALTRALDYRAWHEFVIKRFQDGQWRPATGPASGGERVLAASVPLFAAASAYYKSAGHPHAPRLVALDEAFAGVDDDSRAKCLGLLATFDMDVVMTSEREWGCYPQVPGLAICQLTRREGIDAVLVTPWRWDGRERRRAESPRVTVPDRAAAEPGTSGDILFP